MRKACLTTKVLQRFFQAGREITIEIDAIVTDFANFRRETFSLTFWRDCQLEIWSLRSTSEHGYMHLPGKIILLALINLFVG